MATLNTHHTLTTATPTEQPFILKDEAENDGRPIREPAYTTARLAEDPKDVF